MQPSRAKIITILCLGVLCVSTAAIFVRLALQEAGRVDTGFCLFVSATRLSIASLILISMGWFRGGRDKDTQKEQEPRPPGDGRIYAVAAGVCLAVHFGLWITSLAFTSIVASTTLVTTNPVWVVILSWIFLKERPSPLVLAGVIVAVLGGILIGFGGESTGAAGRDPILGDLLAIGGAIAMSMYLLLGREAQRRDMSIRRYIVWAYTCAAITLLPAPLIFSTGYIGHPAEVYFWIAMMALIPQLLGHTSINWSVRWLSPTLVALVILFEPVASSTLGYFVFQEVPGAFVWLGAGVLLVGVAMATWWSRTTVEADHEP